MRLKKYDNVPGTAEIDANCGELNKLDRERGNAQSLSWVRELAGEQLFEQARRAIALLYLDQPERIAAQFFLAQASRKYADLFALKAMAEEGCVGRQPPADVTAGIAKLVAGLAAMKPPTRERRQSKKGLSEADEAGEPEEPEAEAGEIDDEAPSEKVA